MGNPPVYQSNTPQFPDDSLDISQPQLLANFEVLYNVFKVNHIALDAVSGAGNHSIIQLVEQGNSPQTDISEISVYTKDASSQTDEIFMRYQGNGTEFQFTNYQIYSLVQPINQTAFFTFLPGRILVYFGTFANLPSNILNLNPPIATKIMSVSFCPTSAASLPRQGYKPNIRLIQNPQGYFTGMTVLPSTIFGIPPCYYIVLANV
jgi:hypothetical protein